MSSQGFRRQLPIASPHENRPTYTRIAQNIAKKEAANLCGKDPALVKLDEDAKKAAAPSLETLQRLASLRQELKNG